MLNPEITVIHEWSRFAPPLHRKVNAKCKGKSVSSAHLFENILKANQTTKVLVEPEN
jgi:hypothetical protein